MNIVIAVDKFKGSLTSFEASSSIKAAIASAKPAYNVSTFPMADGGDGFSQVLKYYLKTQTIRINTVDPLHRTIKGYYEWDKKHKIAIIELAVASGIVLLKKNELDPLSTSSYGTGLMMQHAIKKGAKKILLGLGGSATNDGGMGIACALGFVFKDTFGTILKPCGAALSKIHTIEKPSALKNSSIEIACDVNNPLYGKNGAAYVYAPQKGANLDQVIQLDKGLRILAKRIHDETGKKIAYIPGVGAAGGVPAILNGYFNVTMFKGIDLVIQHSGVIKLLSKTDLLITGEGKIDSQSLSGKVVGRLVALAKARKIPVLLVAGMSEMPIRSTLGRYNIIQLLDAKNGLKKTMKYAAQILKQKVEAYFLVNREIK